MKIFRVGLFISLSLIGVVSVASSAFAKPTAKCLRNGGVWLSTEYSSKVLASRIGALPGLGIETDRGTFGFNGDDFLLESFLVLSGVIDGSVIRSESSGTVVSKFQVKKRRNGTSVIRFLNVSTDRVATVGSADGFSAPVVIQENIHSLQSGDIPFTCSRNRLTIKVRNQFGAVTTIAFTPQG